MEESTELAVNRAIAAMRENLGEQITVDDMARAAMFSKFHFTRIFQRATGVSPGRFLSALRLQQAKHLLVSTTLNVADISLRVGYNSVGTFSSRFTKSIGMSPTTYRRRAGYASHIPTDPDLEGDQPSEARVYGEMRLTPGQPTGMIFVGLFPNRIPEGRPARCTVLSRPGPFSFETVPLGTWHLLAQTITPGNESAGSRGDHSGREISVASYGPLEIQHDTVIRVDQTLKPARDLDPPVLLALLDARRLALATVAANASNAAALATIAPTSPAISPLRQSDRTAA